MYFGSGNYDKAIDYVHRIINGPMDLRIDLQCYARLIHLLSHYELGNYEILDSLSKSVQRFMEKMKNFTKAEEALLKFLKNSFDEKNPEKIKMALDKLLEEIKHLENNRHETRAFAYLDLISWVESKVKGKTMEEIVHAKYLKSKHR
jgi:hypothetical protein